MEDNRYAPPKAIVDDAPGTTEAAPALWNPNAAASWCLLFTPIFGAWLHMKNWTALGQTAKADSARNWLYASVGLLVVSTLIALLAPRVPGVRLLNFAFLIAWYYASAKEQARYVLGRFGKNYPRRGWGLPILIAIGAIVGYVLVLGVLFVAIGLR
jgi:uncharacterized membrane protein YidH (DUF202 family)